MRKFLLSAVLVAFSVSANAQVVPFGTLGGGGAATSNGTVISGCTAYSLVYIDSLGALRCAQAAQNSNVSTAGNAITQINATISGSSATNNFLNVTGTFPATLSAATYGSVISITGDNDDIAQNALRVTMTPGAATSSEMHAIHGVVPSVAIGHYSTIGVAGENLNGTNLLSSDNAQTWVFLSNKFSRTAAGVNGWGSSAAGSTGVDGAGTTTASGYLSIGGHFAATNSNAGARSAGVMAAGTGTGTYVGGWFQLGTGALSFPATNTALIAENGAVAGDIFSARDNGSAVFTIADGGSITHASGGSLQLNSPIIVNNDNTLGFASLSNVGGFRHITALTPDSFASMTGTLSNSLHVMEQGDTTFDFQNPCTTGLGTSACTNPTLIVHSHNQDTGEFLSMAHDGKAGVIVGGNSTVLDGTFRLGGTVTLTESSATTVLTVPVAVSTGTGGEIIYTVEARDATNTQIRRGTVRYAVANNSSGTETCGVYGVDNAATVNPAETNDGSGAGAITSGTLTYAWTSDTTGTNQCVLKLNGVSSLTQTTFQFHYTVIQSGPGVPTGGD